MRAHLLSLLQGKSPANLTQRFVADRLRQSVRLVRRVCLVRIPNKDYHADRLHKVAKSFILVSERYFR